VSRPAGCPVVLTADPTLTAEYPLLFDGILVANQTTRTPALLIRALLMPRPRPDGLRARVAPLGLRRIEAALARDAFPRDEVAVVHESQLDRAVGRATRVIGISAGDPLGMGMSTTTSTAIAGGRAWTAASFHRLMQRVRAVIGSSGARVVVGGPGVWQLAARPDAARSLGADHLVTGYAEANAAELFRTLADGGAAPSVVEGARPEPDRVPRILGPSTMGVVEISRGCGLGCSFCTLARTPMRDLPEPTILADAEANVAAGIRHLCVVSEDLFRYGADGPRARPAALLALLDRLRGIDGLGLVQTDHGNVASVAQYTDDELAAVRERMVGATGQRYPWINIGVESAAGDLLRANGCGPKMGSWDEAAWPEACTTQLRRLARAGFLPIASLVVGLPGETAGHVRRTLDWVAALGDKPIAVFPVLYAPIDGSPPLRAGDLSALQWRLVRTCYRRNFTWIPRMVWDAQHAAGAGLPRRVLMQLLGRAQAALWKTTLARRTWRTSRGGRD
jgi:radical SAM superfamily enzyme YgiQ (UPF0313 family)